MCDSSRLDQPAASSSVCDFARGTQPPATSIQHLEFKSQNSKFPLVALFVLLAFFGALVMMRSALLQRPMTDLQVYLRAAWAVRTGTDLYQITDDNGWHYHYLPALAIVLVPLADAPSGETRAGMLPFAVSVAIWYALNVLCLWVSVHWLASALEQSMPDPATHTRPGGCSRWEALRWVPIVACLPPVGHTLMRGQANLLLLLFLSGMMVAALRGQSWRAGFWLAAAICLKVIPVFLLLYPLWRRDARWLAGCALGLVMGLGSLPGLVFGPRQTWAYYEEWSQVVLLPGVGQGTDQSRANELTRVTSTDSQSLLAILHNAANLDPAKRPGDASEQTRWANLLMGGVLTLATLLAAGWQRHRDGPATVVFLGALIILMLLLSPVCHLHYFSLALPLVMGLMTMAWRKHGEPRIGGGLTLLLAINVLANLLPHFATTGASVRVLQILRDVGLATVAALALWLVACVALWRRNSVAVRPAANR